MSSVEIEYWLDGCVHMPSSVSAVDGMIELGVAMFCCLPPVLVATGCLCVVLLLKKSNRFFCGSESFC